MSSPVFYSLCIITVIVSTFLAQAVGKFRLKNCPSIVMEKSNVSCTCLTNMKKPHNVTWPGHSQSGSLSLTNVQRSDNGTHYTCLLTADGVREEVVYTLRVAYGPYDGQVSISPSHFVRNGTQPVTLTCTAEDTYPTPSYKWSGVSCENQVSDDTCTFSLYANDNGREVTCTAESVTLSRKPSYTFHNSVRGTASGTINLNVTLVIPDCGEDLVANSSEQFITSPGYPNRYHRNHYCVWHITASPGQQIWVDSLQMEIESRNPCTRDSVSFYDGDEKNGKMLGKFCKRLGNNVPIMPASGMATVVFISTWGGSGFRLIYKTLPGCIESLTANSSIQTIEPPGYPERYLTNMVCVWKITAPAGKSIRFNFTDFQIEKSRNCFWDYVLIYEGDRGHFVEAYCGSKGSQNKAKFKPVTSFMNKATVVFKSDVLYPGRGFSLQYTATDQRKCSKKKGWRCENSYCISIYQRCNGRDDCNDNSDEINCDTCVGTAWKCNSTRKCIASNDRCDGETECADGSDEQNCDTCVGTAWKCNSTRKCIDSNDRCDGETECADGSDEQNCDYCNGSPKAWKCTTSQCILPSKRCDGNSDCSDGSDERSCPTA